MSFIDKYILPYLKAHVAGLGAGLSVLLTDASGNLAKLGDLSANQWWGAVAATGLLGGFVAYVSNVPESAPVVAPVAAAVPQDNSA